MHAEPANDSAVDSVSSSPARMGARLAELTRHPATAWLVLLSTLLITALAGWLSNSYVMGRAQDRFNFQAEQIHAAIDKRMADYQLALNGGVGLFSASEHVQRQEWHDYIARLNLTENFPGIQGIGYSQWIEPEQLASHVAEIRDQGFPAYRLWPRGTRPGYTAIVYLEPFDARNQRAFGYDMHAEPVRREAMDRARDSGQPSLSGVVTLVQENGEDAQKGFLMYLPVYRNGLPTALVQQRRTALRGFVYAPFRAQDLMRGILGEEPSEIGFELVDGDPGDPAKQLYQHHFSAAQLAVATFTQHKLLGLGGRTWSLRLHSLPGYVSAMDRALPLTVVAGGLLVSLLLFLLVRGLASARREAEVLAEAMTAELRLSHNQLQTIIDNVPFLVWLKDIDGRFIVVNQPYASLSGHATPGELIGKTDLEVWDETLAMQQMADDLAIIRLNQRRLDEQLFQLQGRAAWYEVFKAPLVGLDGQVVGTTGYARDISERKHNDSALRASEERFRSLVEFAPDAIIVINERGLIELCNPAVALFFGYREDELVGHNISLLMASPDREAHDGHLARYLATGQAHIIGTGRDVEARRKDGSLVPIHLRIGEMKREDGSRRFVGFIRDLSERIRVEMALRERKAQFKNVIETAADGFWMTDMQGHLLEVNDAYARRSGYCREELLGMCVSDVEAVEHPEDTARHIAKILDTGSDLFETRHRTKDGRIWDVEISVTYSPTGGGRMIVFCRDITDRKRAEQAMRHAQTMANMGSWTVDLLSGRLTLSDHAARMFGLDQDGIDLQTFLTEHLHPEDRQRVLQAWQQAVDSGETYDEIHRMRASGRLIWVHAKAEMIRDAEGQVSESLGMVQDITDMHEIQAALQDYQQHLEELVSERAAELRSAEARIRLILESTADGLFGMDTEGRFAFVNPAACRMLGYHQQALIGQLVQPTLFHASGDDTTQATDQDRLYLDLHSGLPVRDDDTLCWRADGQPIHVAIAGQPMYSQGELVGAVVSLTDITLRREAAAAREQALKEAERLAGLKNDFLANMSHEIRTPLNAVLGLAQVGQRDSLGRKNQDTFGRILHSGQLLLGLVNDILDFSKIEASKLELENEWFELGEVIDQVVAVNAAQAYGKGLDFQLHEATDLPRQYRGDALRLSQILVNLLSNAVKFTTRGSVTLSLSCRNTHHDSHLIIKVADSGIGISTEQRARLFSAFEQADGSTTRRFGGTGLGLAISKRLVDLMGGTIQVESEPGRGTLFEVWLPLPAGQSDDLENTPIKVVAAHLDSHEALSLGQSLSQFGARLECTDILQALRSPDGSLVLLGENTLLDAGLQDELHAALDRGLRVLAAHTPGSSTSTPMKLPQNVILLDRPLRARHILKAARAELDDQSASAAPRGQRLRDCRILVAEDNEVNCLVLEEMLQGEGAELTCVGNGRLALEQVRQRGAARFDVVLMDVQMPEMDGHAATRQLRQLAPGLPVIGLTAHALAEDRERCQASGMVAHISKPVDLELLVATLQRCARRAGEREPVAQLGVAAQAGDAHAVDKKAVDRLAPPRPREEPLPVSEPGPSSDLGIDWDGLARQFPNKPDFVARLIDLALRSQAGTADALRAALASAEQGDYNPLAFQAHAIKGVAGNLKAQKLVALAARAEHAARAQSSESLVMGQQLLAALQAVLDELRQRHQAYASTLDEPDQPRTNQPSELPTS